MSACTWIQDLTLNSRKSCMHCTGSLSRFLSNIPASVSCLNQSEPMTVQYPLGSEPTITVRDIITVKDWVRGLLRSVQQFRPTVYSREPIENDYSICKDLVKPLLQLLWSPSYSFSESKGEMVRHHNPRVQIVVQNMIGKLKKKQGKWKAATVYACVRVESNITR